MTYIQKTIFVKLEDTKRILAPVIEGKTDAEIKSMLCHCVHKRVSREYSLTKEEQEFYDFLLQKNLRPKTIYQYFLATDYPKHIQTQLKKGEIGISKAQSLSHAYKRMLSKKGAKEM